MVWDGELPRRRREREAARQAGVTQALLGHIGQLPLARSFGLTPRGDFGLGLTNDETAAELGMTGTSFANPNGLDQEGHYSTARDMARLATFAVKNETLVRLCSTRSVTVGGRTMTNHNRLLRSIDGCIGLKTGYTRAAGRTLVSCVRRNGRTLVAVTLQDGNDWADHAALYEFGFGP